MIHLTLKQVVEHKITIHNSGEYPPNIGEIEKVLPDCYLPGVIFTYGDDVYNPSGAPLPPELIVHEKTHACQQAFEGPDIWWMVYLSDRWFRYQEELQAHAFEYMAYGLTHNHDERRRMLKLIAQKLSSGLYGRLPKTRTVMEDIKILVEDQTNISHSVAV